MVNTALDLAIKALEQQPSDDCISRQAVLDIINFEDKWLYDAKSHNADTKIAFSGLESRVKALPSVTPKTEWIPVSERLPDENGSYLVTVKRGYIVLGLWVGVAENWANVIAYMPLPEPYRESEEVPVKDIEGTKDDNEDIPIEYFESGGC
jgi:hypothetical protein